MMREALLVGFALFMLWNVEKIVTTSHVVRPIVVGPVIGLVLGDVTTGVLCGAALETVFMGAIQVGAAVPPDPMLGTGIGTALAILSGAGPEVAFTLGLPIAIMGQTVKIISFMVRSWYMGRSDELAREVEVGKMHFWNWFGLFFQSGLYFILGFAAVYYGVNAVEGFVNGIPEIVMRSLEVAGGLMPAVGFALLLQPMMSKNNFLYFFFGFALVGFMGLSIMAITVIFVIIAFVVVFEKVSNPQQNNVNSEMEDLFND